MDPIMALLSSQELIFVVVLIFLLFGAAKIPDLARALGRAQGEFSKAKRQFEKEVREQDAARTREQERAEVLYRAKERGIETEGRSIEEIEAELAKGSP